MDTDSIRCRLFEEVNGRLEGGLSITQDAYMAVKETDIGIVDITEMYGLSNREFLQALYYAMLFRLPDNRKWEELAENLEEDDYKRELLINIISSPEYKMKGTENAYNVYSFPVSGKKYSVKIPIMLKVKIYAKVVLKSMPFHLYERIRKAVGR